jgi:alpha-beta hydrolase superfamily lysophospholipase
VAEKGYFKSGNNELFYVCSWPSSKMRKTGIVFVHAADSNRLGPHRMYVELSNKLNSLGFATMRFDLSGCGDSRGTVSKSDIESEIKDVLAAINFFIIKTGVENVCLIGISRGSLICFSAAARYQIPIRCMVLLSNPAPSKRIPIKSFRLRMKEYVCKMRSLNTYKRLLTGKVNLKQVFKTLTFALGYNQRYGKTGEQILTTKCPLLFVYGQNDPIAKESSDYYQQICSQNQIHCDSIIVPEANHSFFHYGWKEQIFEHIERWLNKIVGH